MELSDQQLSDFHRDGFTLIKGAFSPDEMEKMGRTFAHLPFLAQQSAYFYDLPGLENLWADPRLVTPARQILGEPVIYYFDGHLLRYCGASPTMTGRHLHHDAKGTIENIYNRLNMALPFTYPILRAAIYMQDTRKQSGGIKVVPGSHRRDVSHFDLKQLEYHNVESEPGDVLLFTHRLLHTPFAMRLADQPDKALSHEDELRLVRDSNARFLPMPSVRETLFLNYGARHELADIHIKHCALMNNGMRGLTDHLITAGCLHDDKPLPVTLRIDGAIVETVSAIDRNLGSQNREGVLLHLTRLMKLCRFHREFSPHYPFFVGQVPDKKSETALRIYSEIGEKLNSYRDMGALASRDPHMATWLPKESVKP